MSLYRYKDGTKVVAMQVKDMVPGLRHYKCVPRWAFKIIQSRKFVSAGKELHLCTHKGWQQVAESDWVIMSRNRIHLCGDDSFHLVHTPWEDKKSS